MSSRIIPLLINGQELPSSTNAVLDVVSPTTGVVVHQYASASPSDVDAAISAASAALPAWRITKPDARRNIFLRAADLLVAKRVELAQHMLDEVGSDQAWADFNIDRTVDMLKDVAGRVGAAINGSIPTMADPGRSAVILKEPYGVCAAIAPWNAPYILGMRSVLFPIAAGNTVVLKGSELSPATMHAIVSLLHEAGVPHGVVNYIAAGREAAPSVTEALVADPRVRKVNFTGSTGVGRVVSRIAGQHLKPIVLELGGKAPAIVWEDADLDVAALQCTLGSFLFAGQICMSTERVIVHKNVSEAFKAKFKATIDAIFPPTGEAPVLVSEQGAEKTRTLVRDALSKGAKLVHGDLDGVVAEISKTRMRPVVIDKLTTDMDIYMSESFGPSVAIIEVDTEEEALRIANDIEHGLNAAVFTQDLRRGLRLARGIEAGSCHINSMTVHDEPALPHGGTKASGYGRFNNSFGLDEWLKPKTVTWDN